MCRAAGDHRVQIQQRALEQLASREYPYGFVTDIEAETIPPVLVDPGSAEHVAGTSIDYTDELNRAGFQIQNPSATATCGCGDSFSV